jgi:hypothetical protein
MEEMSNFEDADEVAAQTGHAARRKQIVQTKWTIQESRGSQVWQANWHNGISRAMSLLQHRRAGISGPHLKSKPAPLQVGTAKVSDQLLHTAD